MNTMSLKEIEKQVKKEERHIKSCRAKIEDLKFDIKATTKALEMWKGMLKSARVIDSHYAKGAR